MITTDDVITFLNEEDQITMGVLYSTDMEGLKRFVKPETNYYALVMLSKARADGLDLNFVDDEKFFKNSDLIIEGQVLDKQSYIEGALYTEYQLSPILIDGYSFIYTDHFLPTVFGYSFDIKGCGDEIVDHFLRKTRFRNDGEWFDQDVQTIQQLTDHINKLLAQSKIKFYFLFQIRRWDRLSWVEAIILLGLGLYYGLKAIYNALKWIFGNSKEIKEPSKASKHS
jgi:hypothetical protein